MMRMISMMIVLAVSLPAIAGPVPVNKALYESAQARRVKYYKALLDVKRDHRLERRKAAAVEHRLNEESEAKGDAAKGLAGGAAAMLALLIGAKGRGNSMAERRARIRSVVIESCDYAEQKKKTSKIANDEAVKVARKHVDALIKSSELRVRGAVKPTWEARIEAEMARRSREP